MKHQTKNRSINEEAWKLLTYDMRNGLHQFDFWHEVPDKVKKLYRAKINSSWNRKNG